MPGIKLIGGSPLSPATCNADRKYVMISNVYMVITIIMDDSLTLPWVAVLDRDALAATVGEEIEVEGPTTVPAFGICEAMRHSM